jgi:hypothetical protein
MLRLTREDAIILSMSLPISTDHPGIDVPSFFSLIYFLLWVYQLSLPHRTRLTPFFLHLSALAYLLPIPTGLLRSLPLLNEGPPLHLRLLRLVLYNISADRSGPG